MFIFPVTQLIALAALIDPEGSELLTKLYIDHNDRLFAIANTVLKNHADCEDAVSLTFMKIWKHIDKFEKLPADETRKLLTTYVVNSAKDVRKTNNAKKNQTVSLTRNDEDRDSKEYDIPDSFNLEELILKDECIKIVARCIDKLQEEDRQIIRLRYNNGFSSRQISEVMNMNANTVDTRISRAKKKLYVMLKEYYNG